MSYIEQIKNLSLSFKERINWDDYFMCLTFLISLVFLLEYEQKHCIYSFFLFIDVY